MGVVHRLRGSTAGEEVATRWKEETIVNRECFRPSIPSASCAIRAGR